MSQKASIKNARKSNPPKTFLWLLGFMPMQTALATHPL